MKTIKEHFLDLGPELAKLAIRACVETLGEERLEKRESTPQNAINRGINWASTTEGHAFWDGVYQVLVLGADYTWPTADSGHQNKGRAMALKALKNLQLQEQAI